MKKRILFVSEFTGLNTGYSVYTHELMKRLHASQKYELAELACVPDPYAEIAMSDGSLCPISLVQTNDFVVTHTGKIQRVNNVLKRNFSGTLVKITREIFGAKCLEVTDNHKILTVRKENAYINKGLNKNSFIKNPKQEWIKANDIKIGDFCCYSDFPRLKEIKKININGISIDLDDDFAFLLGWYLAEGYTGSYSKGSRKTGFCSSLKESVHIINIQNILLKKFNIISNISKRQDNGVFEISFVNEKISKVISILCGDNSYTKHIHHSLYSAPKNFILKMMAAYFEGDGNSNKDRNAITAPTVSYNLARDIVRILLNNNIRCGVRKEKSGRYIISVNGEYCNSIAINFLYKNTEFENLQREENFSINNLHFYKIKQISKREYNGDVYNLSVDHDNSYVCNNYVIHNCYCPHDFPVNTIPWKVYPNLPNPNDQNQRQIYESNPIAEFGDWKFENTCLDFFPDIVCSIRDFWMDAWIDISPFRRFYRTIMMPTVDGTPQHADWIDLYKNTDTVLTYNDWSLELLRKEGGGLINLYKSAPPSADTECFKFISNKREHKSKLGIDPDTFIIGMVARNQRRKLYPDLADAFKLLMSKLSPEKKEKTFLYWHTAHPDLGWDIPRYIKNNGLSSKILFSYVCQNCKLFAPSFYRDVRTICPRCRTGNMVFPFAQSGINREELGTVMGLFDVYVQYVTNEGFGLPIVEAAFCGSPVFATNYSAMEDTLEKLACFKIKPKTLIYECETGRKLAIPDNENFVNQLYTYINYPESLRNKYSNQVYNLAKKHYSSWDDIANIWIEAIEATPNNNINWNAPPNIIMDIREIPSPEQMPDEKFITWAIQNIMGNVTLANRFIGLKMYRDILWGRTNDSRPEAIYGDMSQLGFRPKYAPIDRRKLVENLNMFKDKNNFWENIRWNTIQSTLK